MSLWTDILLRSQLDACNSLKEHLCAALNASSVIILPTADEVILSIEEEKIVILSAEDADEVTLKIVCDD